MKEHKDSQKGVYRKQAVCVRAHEGEKTLCSDSNDNNIRLNMP